MKGHKVADVVVVLQTLPFQKSIEVLANRVIDDLKTLQSLPQVDSKFLNYFIVYLFFHFLKVFCFIEEYGYELNESGFAIKGLLGTVRVRIATVPSNYSKLDPNIHLPVKLLENNSAAIKHV